jgi:hypothetical protein
VAAKKDKKEPFEARIWAFFAFRDKPVTAGWALGRLAKFQPLF